MSLMGIDIGTTGCKAGAFSVNGACLGMAYREYTNTQTAASRAELDSEEVFSKVKAVVAEVAGAAQDNPVNALCVSTMGEAMVPVSQDRRILGNSILSSDLRGGEYAQQLEAEFGQRAFYEINPNIIGCNYAMPKLMWLRDHQPEEYDSAWKYLFWGDFIGFMFGGEPVASYAHANRSLLFDIRAEDWSDRLLAWSGIARAKLPAVAPSGTVKGHVSSAVADELGLAKNAAIVAGAHDQCCNSFGGGAYQPGRAVCGIGTFECVTPSYGGIPATDDMLALNLNVEHQVLPGIYVSFIYNQSGVLVKWYRDTFAQTDRGLAGPGQDIYDLLMAEVPEAPTNLLVLPHFEMTGAPHFISDSAGVIAGLATTTTRGDILKAILEGTTYYFLESIEGLRRLGCDFSSMVATGGGAKSDVWLQLKADILGVPLVRPRFTECGVLGAAMLAGLATGQLDSPESAVERFVRPVAEFTPDTGRHAAYQERFARYRRLYPAMKPLLSELHRAEAATE